MEGERRSKPIEALVWRADWFDRKDLDPGEFEAFAQADSSTTR
jgi:hypothetical protein